VAKLQTLDWFFFFFFFFEHLVATFISYDISWPPLLLLLTCCVLYVNTEQTATQMNLLR